MTTKHSPPAVLRAQAFKIAATIKAAERGEKVDVPFAQKIAEARQRGFFKVGVMMDDKVIILELSSEKIRETDGEALVEYILKLMQEKRATT